MDSMDITANLAILVGTLAFVASAIYGAVVGGRLKSLLLKREHISSGELRLGALKIYLSALFGTIGIAIAYSGLTPGLLTASLGEIFRYFLLPWLLCIVIFPVIVTTMVVAKYVGLNRHNSDGRRSQ